MSIVTYKRHFVFPACHFNGPATYAAYDTLIRWCKGNVAIGVGDFQRFISDMHGHDFVYDIEVRGELDLATRILIDDEALEAIVAQWKNRNLSVLPEFDGMRATTEQMAIVLARKIAAYLDEISTEWISIRVRIGETAEIMVQHILANERA